MKRRILLGLALAAAAGCAVSIPEPTPQMAAGDDAVLSDLKAGRTLYVNKCSGCHSLHPVEKYSDATWTSEVEEMTRLNKVKLRPEERARLLLYLTTANGRE